MNGEYIYMNRRKFISSLGAGLVSLGIAGCGLKSVQNTGEPEGTGSGIPGNQTTAEEQPATSTGNISKADSAETTTGQTGSQEQKATNAGNGGKTGGNSAEPPAQPPSPRNTVLVAYFSHTGNTRKIANQIHSLVGSDIFEIKTVNPYPEEFYACLDQATRESKENIRPQLKTRVQNMDAYEVIFLGYPYWIGTMPMALFTFLESYDFSNKTIVPFCTYKQSGMGGVSHIRQLCRKSTIREGLAVQQDNVNTAQTQVSAWLHGLGYM